MCVCELACGHIWFVVLRFCMLICVSVGLIVVLVIGRLRLCMATFFLSNELRSIPMLMGPRRKIGG